MIVFEKNVYFLYFWLIPVLILFYWLDHRWRFKAQLELGDKKLVKNLIIGASPFLKLLKFILLLFGLSALILALANAQIHSEAKKAYEPAKSEVVFAIDVSKSMLSQDILPSRLEQAKRTIFRTSEQLSGELLGLVVFAGKAYPYLPLTADYTAFNLSIRTLTTDSAPLPGTSLADALRKATWLPSPETRTNRIICLLSDGEGHDKNFIQVADSIKSRGIKIITIGLGTPAGGTIPVLNKISPKLNKDGLIIISKLSKQNLLAITSEKGYIEFQTVDQTSDFIINSIKQSYLGKKIVARKEGTKSFYQIFLLCAFGILLLETIIPEKRFKIDTKH